jgi:regulator of cell morphogenesis and NO signaling
MTMKAIDVSTTVNDVLKQYPGTVSIFNAFGIDACCGGAASLREAARRDGVDLAELLAALQPAVTRVEVPR